MAILLAGLLACQKSTSESPGPVLVIGVDGAEWKVIEPLVAAGRLPNFTRLMARGSYGDLESIEPILSPIIWTTIATGRDPEDHGVTWFMERNPATGKSRPVTSRLRKTVALWNIASAAGLSVGVVGWWASWPAEEVNGWIITDHVAPHGFGLSARGVSTSLGRTHPPELLSRIQRLMVSPKQIPDAEILAYMDISATELATRRGDQMTFGNPLHHFLWALAAHHTYEALGLYTLEKLSPDLTLVYFEAVDSLSHLFMKYAAPPMPGLDKELRRKFQNVVAAIYEQQDRALGTLVQAAGPRATVVLVSDHGFKTGNQRLIEADYTNVKEAHRWHEKEGVIILAGPAFRSGVRLDARVHDVTPTVLHLLGLPVAEDMPGRVLEEAFRPRFLAAYPPRSVPTHERTAARSADSPPVPAADIDAGVVERLAALGYIDTGATPEILLNDARIAMSKGDEVAARAKLSELLAAHPENFEGMLFLAKIHLRAAEYAAAEALYRRLLARADVGRHRELQRQHATALMHWQRYAAAEAIWRELLAAKREQVDDRYHLALSLEGQKRWREARAEYESILDENAGHVFTHNNLAGVLLRLGERRGAMRHFERAAALDPGHAESRFNLGVLLDEDGRPAAASAMYREAAAARPNFTQPRWALARSSFRRGDFATAERWLAELAEITPEDSEIWAMRARVAAARGDVEATRSHRARRHRDQRRAPP